MSTYTNAFWRDAGERAVATFAQTLSSLILVALGGELTGAVNILTLDWGNIAGVAGGIVAVSLLAALLSILKAVGVGRHDGNPSVGNRQVPILVEPEDDTSGPELVG